MTRTWFITGTSRGFGRAWAEAALQRGDRVAGTARTLTDIDDLAERFPDTFAAIQLDVTDRPQAFQAIASARDRLGELDIVVNNAGYGQFGMAEELTEQQLRDQIDTNLLGPIWVVQAALPHLRAAGRGHIVQVSSVGGIIANPAISAYHASKWGLEGFSEALAAEIAPFGINLTLVEPGAFATDFGTRDTPTPIPAYDPLRTRLAERRAAMRPGDPTASARAILHIVDSPNPPLRILFGNGPLQAVGTTYAQRLALWHEWQHITEEAQGEQPS
jgi:NAD(P)-dependent dehydrogenase (short-subunit alcohol dehydrogenase family)